MKVKRFLMLGVVAVCSLTACAKEVSPADFQAEIDKIEPYSYNQAKAKYKCTADGSGVFASDANQFKTGEITVTFGKNSGNQNIDPMNELVRACASYIFTIQGINLSNLMSSLRQNDMITTFSFYTGPLSMKYVTSGIKTENGIDIKMKYVGNYQFEKYGYCVKATETFEAKVDYKEKGITIEGSLKVTQKATVSYKNV